ncbi:helix-turn-helix domain-containing protein [Stenotrophomonas rhizophila]|uniref:helix-turn-helix domain-containing protein n=1 Tax=Stenotrophomonas rhizophila TaxID=216778 RepID=UPI001E442885|nr:helix-turn-helix domain-containing protein [Stenotrophomonas rhizophila]MCC7633469.1 helix-turn-helix domain-containing protein [Stenotrophomonas rhizophila]MCC7663046.1 helix-turn-helix domain-containing protein [Stenotrophomonas rhizophila]
MTRPHPGTALSAVEDPATPGCSPLRDCLHCSVRHLAVCSALAPEEVQALERVTVSLPLPLGATLARAGEPRQHVYTLTGGALRLVRTLSDGRRQISGFVLPGNYLGLTGSDHHRYDIEAIADSRVCRVALPQMKDLRARFPHLERKLLQRACQELDDAHDAALSLGRLQPAEKLADFLLRLAARQARLGENGLRVTLPMGRGDIADHLGLTMETVSRTFTKLRQQGLIALPHLNTVEILDEDGLRLLSADETY